VAKSLKWKVRLRFELQTRDVEACFGQETKNYRACSTHKCSTEDGLVQILVTKSELGSGADPADLGDFFCICYKNNAFWHIKLKFCLKAEKIGSLLRVKYLNIPEKRLPEKVEESGTPRKSALPHGSVTYEFNHIRLSSICYRYLKARSHFSKALFQLVLF